MSAITNIQPVPLSIAVMPAAQTRSPVVSEAKIEGDTVEISQTGRMLSDLSVESSFDLARLRAIRSAIHNGTYETPERFDATIDRLINALG